jgi:hypothetical protein
MLGSWGMEPPAWSFAYLGCGVVLSFDRTTSLLVPGTQLITRTPTTLPLLETGWPDLSASTHFAEDRIQSIGASIDCSRTISIKSITVSRSSQASSRMMRPTNLTKLTRAACRGAQASRVARVFVRAMARPPVGLRSISTTSTHNIAILPDREGKPKESEPSPVSVAAADITEAEYHQLADEYLETLLSKFEELQDAREDVDVEFSVSCKTNCLCDCTILLASLQLLMIS